MPTVAVEMSEDKLSRYQNGEPVTVTKTPVFKVWTNHPNAANEGYRAGVYDATGEWIVPLNVEARSATEAAQQRMDQLGDCASNSPVLFKVKAEVPFSSPLYFSGVIIKATGERVVTKLDIN